MANSGDIIGDVVSFGNADTLSNTGVIRGDVSLGNDSDTLFNSGTIHGDLGTGDDTYMAAGTSAVLPFGFSALWRHG